MKAKPLLFLIVLILSPLLNAQTIPPWINGGKPWWTGRPPVVRPPAIIKHWIKKNIDSGAYIHKLDAMLWLPISNIIVVKSTTGSPGYDYLLINTDDKEKAHAKFMGKT